METTSNNILLNHQMHNEKTIPFTSKKEPVLTRKYVGDQLHAIEYSEVDAAFLAKEGYYPRFQTWTEGPSRWGLFTLALLSSIVFIGLLIFIYMLLTRPPGSLNTTYEYREGGRMEACANCAGEKSFTTNTCIHCGQIQSI
jgi:hypothetical protein